ncbi:hypothetical protein KR038_011902 [Drosophila bunnanda]|nr:hypothetical protein KR038_011902 [Drosophila bunnanda]
MLGVLSLWFISYLFGRIQGRSVGGLDEWQQEVKAWLSFCSLETHSKSPLCSQFLAPQPDATIFVYNQTDKELALGQAWR